MSESRNTLTRVATREISRPFFIRDGDFFIFRWNEINVQAGPAQLQVSLKVLKQSGNVA